MKQIYGLALTGFSLVALYLVLTNWMGTTSIIGAGTGGYANIVRTLQGRG